jgi:hypothetical protein
MRRITLMMLVPLVAGCNVHSKNPANGDENVTINAEENGQVTFNLPFASGQVKLPEGMMKNGDFDIDGVKMVPGGTISGFNVDAGDKGATVHLAFKAPGSPDNVRAYFVDQFKAKGVEASASGTGVSGTTKDGDPFVIVVGPAAQGSQGTITIEADHEAR